ncbi:MAG: PAS domain-containing protein [Fuerstiella sp.]
MEAKVAARTDQLLKKTEEAEQLALVAQYTDNAVVITNALAQIQWVNEGFIRTSGYSLDEVRGKSPGSFLQGPNTDINTIQYMRQQLSRGQGFEVEIVNYNKQQQPYWVVIECRPIYNEHGDVTRFIAIESDITDRKKREEQLRLYSKAFTEANDAIIISEVPAGGGMAKILSVNAAFERMTGYTNAEVVGRNPRMLQGAGTDPAARARIRDSLKRWAPVREEMLNYKKNGEEFWVELNIAPLANEAGQFTHWVSVQRNITERKQLERNVVERTLELENAKEKAETANKLKSEFLANMSHEIRTPLNGVMGMLELLIGTELTDKQRGYAEISHNSANTLLALINDILDYSKIEAEQLTLESTPFNLRKMAEEITAIAATQVAVRSVEVILDYPSSTPSGVVGDPLRLRQVITNLLGNAIKFTESGYIVVEINAVLTEQKEHCFRIAVRDTGVGIPEEKQQYIFGKFAQADGSTTRKYGGTGLGLAISQHLVRLMGGRIHLNSEVGHGSEFAFHVSMPEADVSESEVFPMASLSQARLLVVDDLKINRLILMEQLQGKVQHIEAVDSGQKALEKLRKAAAAGSPYNIAIIDQQMPEMCGETLAFKISTSNEIPTLGMILLSSNGTDGIPADVGFSERLVKPTAHRVLLKVIGTVLAKVNKTSALPKSADNVEPAFQSLRKVLLADDNVINQLVGKEALERLGCDVTVVKNGKTALNALQSDSFEMIFMDCQMPVMDGYEATRLLRSHENASNRIPVIALTANALAGDRENCMAAGMDDYLPKPFGLTELQEIINKWGRPVS